MATSRLFSTPFQLLELNVISGQDLALVSRKMRSYAVVWVHHDRKLTTRIDIGGHNSPTWNDKFVFRVDDEFLSCETSAIMIEIYALHWFRDVHVGTVRVLVSNLIPPAFLARQHQPHRAHVGMRFVALQVLQPSGQPQGILNIGVALLDASLRSMPLYSQTTSAVGYLHLMGEKNDHHKDGDNKSSNQLLPPWIPKPELRRTKSESSSMFGSSMIGKRNINHRKISVVDKEKNSNASSIINGSEIVNKKSDFGALAKAKYGSDISGGTSNNEFSFNLKFKGGTPKKMRLIDAGEPHLMTESELGSSASEVAGAMLKNKKQQHRAEETESEIMGTWSLESSLEGLQSKLERWRTELPPVYDGSELSSLPISSVIDGGRGAAGYNRRRRISDGGFSCFSSVCGIECSIVCGGSSVNKKKARMKRSPSLGDFRFR